MAAASDFLSILCAAQAQAVAWINGRARENKREQENR